MKVIGIVGGVASGKTLVARLFQRCGATLIEADRIGHQVLRLDRVKRAVRKDWGESVFDEAGEISRPAMAESVFGDDIVSRARLVRLEQITHPLIGEQIRDEISRLREASLTPAVALDAPVLIKAGWDRLCDELVFVSADAEARRRRALARGWTEEEWRRREEAQTPLTRMRAASSEVVENSGDAAAAERQVMALWQKWGFSFPATESLASAR